jgi:hypothetical protein
MSFSYAGNLIGEGSPVVRKFLTGETMYEGQLLKSARVGGIGGHVNPADTAIEAREDTSQILGICSGIVDGSSGYVTPVSGTAKYGQRTVYSSTMADITSRGPSEVEVTLIIPGITLVKADIFDVVWGTALTELTVTTTTAGGASIAHSGNTIAGIVDDFSTIYCRSGANRGHYRVVTSAGANTNVVTVPFPYTITAGDVFVQATCVLGLGGMQVTTGIDAIDGDAVLDATTGTGYYTVFYHEINLEETGQEYAVFSMWAGPDANAST